jgi:hypothetical protein
MQAVPLLELLAGLMLKIWGYLFLMRQVSSLLRAVDVLSHTPLLFQRHCF